MPVKITLTAAFIAGASGAYSHVFLDGLMHTDLKPFYPFSESNPFLGILDFALLHNLCVGSAALGLVIWYVARALYKHPFQSNEAFFQAVEDLIAGLEAEGLHQAADELRQGYSCLNGLTDGAAEFLNSIEHVEESAGRLIPKNRKALEAIRETVFNKVYGR